LISRLIFSFRQNHAESALIADEMKATWREAATRRVARNATEATYL